MVVLAFAPVLVALFLAGYLADAAVALAGRVWGAWHGRG